MKIGILGGGQLGRMLWEASVSLGPRLQPSPVFHETKKCPAGFGGSEVVAGTVIDKNQLTAFFKSVDTFAIENEFLPLECIESAWSAAGKADSLARPSHEGLAVAQDKLEQKKFFNQNGFPTSTFVEITADWFADGSKKIAALHSEWQGLVLKKARMGYDGKGNLALPPAATESQTGLDLKQIQEFCESAYQNKSRVYAERFVPFAREVALVSVRSYAGDFGFYPLVQTVQKNGVCLLAFKALDSIALEKKAAEIARTVGDKLNLLGTFAVEFFVTADGQLLVNEMAPRVHNSGHFTQSAARCSQFQMHLKAYFQQIFAKSDFECAPAFAMINLLGPAGLHQKVQKPQAMNCYWYDKESTSPGRKLGHIIAQSSLESDLPELIQTLKASEHHWQESLK